MALFIVIQAIQPAKNTGSASGPKDIASVIQVPNDVMTVMKKSCYDCHSDSTYYPWYDNITPVNWWVAHHINEGKRELNFTVFGDYSPRRKAKKLEESAKQIEKDEMPLQSYLIMHSDAKLSEAQKKLLIDWFKAARAAIGAPTDEPKENND